MTIGSGHALGTEVAENGDSIRAMLTVSRAVASGGPLANVLGEIAAQASYVMNAESASIVELAGERLSIVGSHQLSSGYRRRLETWSVPLAPGRGPAGLAVRSRATILSTDATGDPRFADYAELLRAEGYRAVASVPLVFGETVLGALTLYRKLAVGWGKAEVRWLTFFADHAATAIRTAQLIAEQQRQVSALERLVMRLREQTHEHANRIYAIVGLLAAGDADEALAFVGELTDAHISDRQIFERQPSANALAGLLWVEAILARQRSVDLELDVLDDLDRLPLTDAQALTIIGNLLDNAFDCVADMPDPRRRVQLTISETGSSIRVRVRDWGPGVSRPDDLFAEGVSTKSDHAGVGLSLVRDAVQAARGSISVERHPEGMAFVVTLAAPPGA